MGTRLLDTLNHHNSFLDKSPLPTMEDYSHSNFSLLSSAPVIWRLYPNKKTIRSKEAKYNILLVLRKKNMA